MTLEEVVCTPDRWGAVEGEIVHGAAATCGEEESVGWVCDVDSQAGDEYWTVRLKLVFSMAIPRPFG